MIKAALIVFTALAGAHAHAKLNCQFSNAAEKLTLKKNGEVYEAQGADGTRAQIVDVSPFPVFVGYGLQEVALDAQILSGSQVVAFAKFSLFPGQTISLGSPQGIVSCSLID